MLPPFAISFFTPELPGVEQALPVQKANRKVSILAAVLGLVLVFKRQR